MLCSCLVTGRVCSCHVCLLFPVIFLSAQSLGCVPLLVFIQHTHTHGHCKTHRYGRMTVTNIRHASFSSISQCKLVHYRSLFQCVWLKLSKPQLKWSVRKWLGEQHPKLFQDSFRKVSSIRSTYSDECFIAPLRFWENGMPAFTCSQKHAFLQIHTPNTTPNPYQLCWILFVQWSLQPSHGQGLTAIKKGIVIFSRLVVHP